MFDFGLGSTELILIAIVALIVIGPRDFPKVLRTVGQVMTKVRAMAREFQGHIEDAAKESGFDDLKKDISKAASFDVDESFDVNEALNNIGREPGKVSTSSTSDTPAAKPDSDAKAAKTTAAAKKTTATKKPAATKKTAAAKKSASTTKAASKKKATAGDKTA